jgi:hypothetical protein
MAKTSKKAPAKGADKAEAAQEVVTVNAKAVSKDVGPAVIGELAKTYDMETEANAMLNRVDAGRYTAMTMTTEAIVKAAKADKSIDLSLAFSDDKKEVERLNTQIGLALGFREYHDTGKGKHRLIYAKSVQKYFPAPTDVKGSVEAVKKATLRSNFTHMLKKCARAACAIVENNITAKADPKAGTLRISGPKVEEVFGQKEVLLNEKQKVQVKGQEKPVELKDKPSFTALASVAAADHGATVSRKSTARGQRVLTDPVAAIESLCTSLVNAVSKLEAPIDAKAIKAMESVRSALDKVLD